MARSIWKGSISFGLVNIPVGLFPAEERDEISFRQLDRRSMSPIGYRKYNKETGEDVAQDQIVKGYEYEEGRYVLLTDEDLRKANPKATQTVEITGFVEAGEIPYTYFDKPYYLAPLQKAFKGYALLRDALKRTGKVGLAQVVIRSRQYLAAVIPLGPALVLELLRYPHEIRGFRDLELPDEDGSEAGVSARELAMAEQLVEGMTTAWDPEHYRDEYRDDLLALVREKAETGQVKRPRQAAAPATGVIDIMSLLKRSVQESGKGRGKRSSPARPAAKRAVKSAAAKKPARARQRKSA
jgi:DNA end-binding protein Ku